MISVLIVDDHVIVRRGLRQVLDETEDIRVEGEAGSVAEAMVAARERAWDVVVLDINLPDGNGIDVLRTLRRDHPRLPVLVLSMHPESQIAIQALRSGASGYLSKQSVPSQLVTAIRQVNGGRRYVTPALAEKLAELIGPDAPRAAHDSLSQREYQTMCLIAAGKSTAEVAEHLGLSVKTLNVYRARLLEKLGLRSNAEITYYAIRNGLIDLSG